MEIKLGNKIRTLRKQKDISQDVLAEIDKQIAELYS